MTDCANERQSNSMERLSNGVAHRTNFGEVSVCRFASDDPDNLRTEVLETQVALFLLADSHELQLEKNGVCLQKFDTKKYEVSTLLNKFILFINGADSFSNESPSLILRFDKSEELIEFMAAFRLAKSLERTENGCDTQNSCKPKKRKNSSEFEARTEEASAAQYFQFYGYLFQQQNMMQDYVRTSTYQRAIHDNSVDFRDKIVMDVGAGSGILSFFAVQAGAKRVYAVEASSMAAHCQELVRTNNLSSKVIVVAGKIEEVSIPEPVDVIISEPMGYMLVNERMLESYVHSRKFLKPDGRMFPTTADLHFALFSDEALYLEQSQRCSFWCQENFHGVNLASLKNQAFEEVFRQPVVDSWNMGILISRTVMWSYDFEKDSAEKLHDITIPFELAVTRTCFLHGLASWFDVAFIGSARKVWLSTAPSEPLTHWYQVRCLLPTPIMVFSGQVVKGHLLMTANERQSYDLKMEIDANGCTYSNTFDLKTPHFRYTGQPTTAPPPGSHNECPSEQFIQHLQHMPIDAVGVMSVNNIPMPPADTISMDKLNSHACHLNGSPEENIELLEA
ncbi:ribosomal protein l11 methyltransferase (PrmA) domain-containing protein [Ditylenchus destructor]|nr:ribosomal protein l11 methyltransferase (PrmA) domain-containing protein [Ditylenchus destructor]